MIIKRSECAKISNSVLITVMTPTYNREYKLPVLYKTLCEQHYDKYEWIVVDDGSTDGTDSLLSEWISINLFPIIYIQKDNGGKHSAINEALNYARGKLFFIIDSDDYILPNVLQWIEMHYKTIEKDSFAGLSGMRATKDGKIIGGKIAEEYIDAKNTERSKYNLLGDKAEVYFTKILRDNPFPIIPNENFMMETVIWNKLSYLGYKIRWYNKPFIVTEYLSDGLTQHAEEINIKNPEGYMLSLRCDLQYINPSWFYRIYYYYNRYFKFAKLVTNKPFSKTVKDCQTTYIELLLSILIRKGVEVIKGVINYEKSI